MKAIEKSVVEKALAVVKKHERLLPPARLIFGLDLTGSREAGLKQARIATAAMFDTIRSIGRVELKLVHYRGTDEFNESQWSGDAAVLRDIMLNLSCQYGSTQIGRLLERVLAEPERIAGVVFIGDHNEEDPYRLMVMAKMLGRKSIPLFIFHEYDRQDRYSFIAQALFLRMAEASGGVYVPFNLKSASALREILAGVAAFSIAGIRGVERLALPVSGEARQLHRNLRLMLGPGVTPVKR
jgi:hypothetical protein